MSLVLRDYQKNIIAEARAQMRAGVKSVLIQSATGSGKTILTASMFGTASAKGMRSFFIVPRRELIKQSSRAFKLANIPHGIIAADWPEQLHFKTQICSIQTLINRYTRLARPNLIAWDECDGQAAKTWDTIYSHFKDSYHIGLSATPQRTDGKGLGKYYQKLINGPSVQWLIENGYLSRYRMFAPGSISMKGVHTRMGDYVKSELESVVDKPSITGDAIMEYKKRCDGKRAIVFAVSIKHSHNIVNMFNAAGIAAEHVDGETPTITRDAAIERFRRGETKIISNVDLFTRGLDLPNMEAVILLRPTQSLALYLQMVGRGLRICEGKEYAYILDHAGNCKTHGLPDDERTWSLEGFADNKNSGDGSGPSVKVCPSCFAAQFSGRPSCNFCGHTFEIKSRKIEEIDGDLEEISRVTKITERKVEQRSSKSLEDLYQLGIKRGYKNARAWSKYVFNARQAKKLRGNG